MANLIVTIDGPAASGKSTVARLLADRLGASFLDTGAMYRAVTLAAIRAGADMNDEEELLGVLDNIEFQFVARESKMAVCIDGVDVTEQIRQPEVTAKAQYIASAAKLRAKLVQMQRQFAAGEERIIAEGRDQGTVVFPDADIKFYLTADTIERARRRQAELYPPQAGPAPRPALRKGGPRRDGAGRGESLEKIQRTIEERDKSDESRAVGPLKPASDAIVLDTTDLSIKEVVEKLLCCVKEKCLKES